MMSDSDPHQARQEVERAKETTPRRPKMNEHELQPEQQERDVWWTEDDDEVQQKLTASVLSVEHMWLRPEGTRDDFCPFSYDFGACSTVLQTIKTTGDVYHLLYELKRDPTGEAPFRVWLGEEDARIHQDHKEIGGSFEYCPICARLQLLVDLACRYMERNEPDWVYFSIKYHWRPTYQGELPPGYVSDETDDEGSPD